MSCSQINNFHTLCGFLDYFYFGLQWNLHNFSFFPSSRIGRNMRIGHFRKNNKRYAISPLRRPKVTKSASLIVMGVARATVTEHVCRVGKAWWRTCQINVDFSWPSLVRGPSVVRGFEGQNFSSRKPRTREVLLYSEIQSSENGYFRNPAARNSGGFTPNSEFKRSI